MGARELRRPLAWGLALYCAVLAGLWRHGAFRVLAPPDLAAKVRAEETALEGTLLSGVTPKRPGDRYWLMADAADGLPAGPAKILVYLAKGSEESARLRPGQRLRFSGRLRGPARPRNPGDFDEAAFLDMRGAALVLHARRVSLLAPPPWQWRPWAWGESVHLSIHGWLGKRFDAVTASVLEGLALGYRGALPRDLERDFQRAGVLQFLTPSADKLTLAMGAALLMGMGLGLAPGARALLVLGAGAVQLLIVIPDPSHTRPYLMAAAALAARRLQRDPGLFQIWLLAAWATLLWDPRQLFNAGFVLTYGALLAIIAVLPRWSAPESWPPASRLLVGALGLEIVLSVALAPAFASYFGVISLAAPAVNLLAFPAASAAAVAVWSGWLLSLLPAPLDALAGPWRWAAQALCDALIAACRLASAQPWAAVKTPAPSAAGLVVYALGAAALFALPARRRSRALGGAALCVAAALGAARAMTPPRLSVTVLDAPKGGTAWASLADGRRLALGDGSAPAALALGAARLVWRGGALVAALGGKEVYCVRSGPPSTTTLPCPASATVSTRRSGAVELATDGRQIELVFLVPRGVGRGLGP